MSVTKFGSHYLPTYVPELDGTTAEFYQKMFAQMEEMDRLNYDHIWVTEHHFAHYGGDLPHPPTFLSALARTTKKIRLGVAINVLPLHNPIDYRRVLCDGRCDFRMAVWISVSARAAKRTSTRNIASTRRKRPGACTKASRSCCKRGPINR